MRVFAVVVLAAIAILLGLWTGRRGDTPRADSRTGLPAPVAAHPAPGAPDESPHAVVSGLVTGRYGPMVAVPVAVRQDGEVVASTVTNNLGRYRLDVPAGADLDIEVVPMPETELAPARRAIFPAPGEDLTVDFELARGGSATGVIRGRGLFCLDVVAIRAEDYPTGPDPPPIAALEAAPKIGAQTTGAYVGEAWPPAHSDTAFAFRGLDPAATYRLAVLDRAWALDRAVFFRAGDHAVSARVERVLRVFVEATDMETREPIARFRVSLATEGGTVLETLDGDGGRLSICLRGDRSNPKSLIVAADDYLDATCPAEGVHRVALQRARPANVLIRIEYLDAMPYTGEIDAAFESLDDPDGFLDAAVQKSGPGSFRMTLPVGNWRLRVGRPRAFHDVAQIADVEVPTQGTAETTIRYRRGGTVTFESNMVVERHADGEWESLIVKEGTWEDMPPGTYRVMQGEKEHARFEVAAGTSHAVRRPPQKPDGPGSEGDE